MRYGIQEVYKDINTFEVKDNVYQTRLVCKLNEIKKNL